MVQNTQSRKWTITINNPRTYGYDSEKIKQLLGLLTTQYYCMCDEVGESGTQHTHIYLYSKSPIRFNRLKTLFNEAHIETARGSSRENRDYIKKTGKWENDKKSETNIRETFYEVGSLPDERDKQENKQEKLFEMIDSGMSTKEIISEDKSYIYRVKQIEELRQIILEEKYMEVDRKVEVIYISGPTGTGKTYGIQQKHGSKDICRITSYHRSGNGVYFDAYKCEPVLVFEEFNSQIPIEDMLNYLDVYPIKLPARYADKVACYTTVYITSNMPLYDQYKSIQREKIETWQAFTRRISKVIEYRVDGTNVEMENKEYRKWNMNNEMS